MTNHVLPPFQLSFYYYTVIRYEIYTKLPSKWIAILF